MPDFGSEPDVGSQEPNTQFSARLSAQVDTAIRETAAERPTLGLDRGPTVAPTRTQ